MAAQYVVVALKVENIHSGWLSSGKLVAPKEDNIQYKIKYQKPLDVVVALKH